MKKRKYGTCPQCGSKILADVSMVCVSFFCEKDTKTVVHDLWKMDGKEFYYSATLAFKDLGYRHVKKHSAKEIAKTCRQMKKEMCWRKPGCEDITTFG